jgi:hypothetical protein
LFGPLRVVSGVSRRLHSFNFIMRGTVSNSNNNIMRGTVSNSNNNIMRGTGSNSNNNIMRGGLKSRFVRGLSTKGKEMQISLAKEFKFKYV